MAAGRGWGLMSQVVRVGSVEAEWFNVYKGFQGRGVRF